MTSSNPNMEVISEADTAFGRSHLLAITTKGIPASSGSESNLGNNQGELKAEGRGREGGRRRRGKRRGMQEKKHEGGE